RPPSSGPRTSPRRRAGKDPAACGSRGVGRPAPVRSRRPCADGHGELLISSSRIAESLGIDLAVAGGSSPFVRNRDHPISPGQSRFFTGSAAVRRPRGESAAAGTEGVRAKGGGGPDSLGPGREGPTEPSFKTRPV